MYTDIFYSFQRLCKRSAEALISPNLALHIPERLSVAARILWGNTGCSLYTLLHKTIHLFKQDRFNGEHRSRRAKRVANEVSSCREYDQGKVTYNDIYFQQKSLWPIFFPFSSRKLSPEVDRTGANLILISVTKWQETIVNKCHEHILL